MCSKQFWSIASIIHKYDRKDLIQTTNYLSLAVTVFSIIGFITFRCFQNKMYQTIDKENQTQDDFTIFVENIEIVDLNGLQDTTVNNKDEYNYKDGL